MSNQPVGNAAKIPNLPITQVSDPQLRPVVDAIRNIFNTRAFGKDDMEKWVTWRDLVDSNVVQVVKGGTTIVGGSGGGTVFRPLGDENDLTPPPAPTGFSVDGAFANIIMDWDNPEDAYANHAYTEIWRSGTNERSTAVLVGTARGAVYADVVGNSQTYYYWIRFVSVANVKGPYNSLVGTLGQTSADPGYLLELLTGEITESQLYSSLATRINLIDAGSGVPGSVNNRIAAETTARAAAIQAEASARAQGLLDEAAARNTAINTERSAREQAILDESLTRSAAIAAEAQARSNAILAESQARDAAILVESNTRQAADESLASQITTVSSNLNTVNSTLTSAIQAEQTARSTAISAEASARDTLAAQLRGNYTGNDLSQLTTGLLFSERQARVTEDAALSSRIDTLVAASSGDFQDLEAVITAEQTARIAGDQANATSINTLQARLDNVKDANGNPTSKSIEATLVDNKQAQVDGDSALSSSITALTSTVNNNYNTLNSAITTESTTRANAISAEATARTSLATQVRGNYTGTDITQVSGGLIQAERNARVTADSSLQTQINTLSSSTTTSLNQLTSAIQTEQTTRTNAIAAEAASRETLAAQMRGTYTGSDLNQVTTGLLYEEKQARTTQDSALSTSISALSSTVTNNYNTLNSAITSEATTRANADTALTSQINTLSSTVTNNYNTLNSAITNEATTRANADTAFTSQINTVSAQATKTRTYYQTAAPSTGMITGDLWFDTDDKNKLYRYSGTAWVAADDTRIADNAAAITAEATARANADSSLATQINTVSAQATKTRTYRQTDAPTTGMIAGDLWFDTDDNNKTYRYSGTAWEATDDARLASNAAAIQTEATARANGDSALATQITTLSSTVNTNNTNLTAAIQSEATTRANADGALQAQYTVKTDVAGHVAGFGLASTANNSTPTSAFGVRADSFWVAPASTSSATAPTTGLYAGRVWLDTSVTPNVTKYYTGSAWSTTPQNLPFVVRATPTTINGVAVPAGVYIQAAYIENGSISNAKIGNAAIDSAKIADAAIVSAKIDSAAITSAKIQDGAITNAKIATATITAANIQDAAITNAKIASLDATKITAGTISADRIAANSITASKIDSRGLSIKDEAGNVILAAGTALPTSYVTPSDRWLGNLIDLDWWKPGAAIPWSLNGEANYVLTSSLLAVNGYQGAPDSVWYAQEVSNNGEQGGGWNASITLNANKTYRFAVPVLVAGNSAAGSGSAYWGTQNVCNLNTTTVNGNPYFAVINRSGLTPGRWYMFVGYVYPYGSTSNTNAGAGIYDCVTGVKVGEGTNYCHAASGANVHRAYQYYANNEAVTLFGRPMIHLIDGSEPPLDSLLGGAISGRNPITPGNVSTFISSAAIGNAQIANASISSAKIADAAITNAKIANAAIDSAKIANAAITSAKIGVAEIDTLRIAGNSVTVSSSVATYDVWSSMWLNAPYGGTITIIIYVDGSSFGGNMVNTYFNGGLIGQAIGSEIFDYNFQNTKWTPHTVVYVLGVGAGNHHIQIYNTGGTANGTGRPVVRAVGLLTQR